MNDSVLKKSDFFYELPERLIAQDPLENRSSSRLLVLNKKTGDYKHTHFDHIIDYLNRGDCLVINNTKVIPARLIGVREVDNIPVHKGFDAPKPGAVVEILLLKRLEGNCWEAIVKPGKKLKEGARVSFGNGELKCEIISVKDDGNRIVRFDFESRLNEIAKIKGGDITLSEKPADIESGFILSYGLISENCSFRSILESEKDSVRDTAASFLFR